MELLYIWIEKYKNIEKQGFNFSSKHRFEFNYKTGELKHEEDANYIENFFGVNITNVTAIIGENGAGKTTLLEFTRDIFVNSIFENPDGIFCITKHNQTDKKYKIQGYKELLESVILVSKKEDVFEKYYHHKTKNGGFSLPFAKTGTVINYNPPVLFYSNIYDGKREYYHSSHIVSISTNYLLEMEDITTEDIIRQIIFISKTKLNNIKIRLPNSISFTINTKVNLGKVNEFHLEDLSWYLHSIENFFELDIYPLKLPEIDDETIPRKHLGFIDDLSKVIIYNFINSFLGKNKDEIEKLEEALKDCYEGLQEGDFLNTTKKILKKYIEKTTHNTGIDTLLDILEFFINQSSIRHNKAYYEITEKNTNRLLNILEKYKNRGLLSAFLSLSWNGLSSGEMALLNLYSRFYDTIEDKKDLKELTILIDEGETGFHPQWQKQYLKILIDFLPQIFPKKKIQIILTSHTPFLVSDLPKENIIFLSKNDEGKCIVSKLQDRKETFGANIHTLFTDSFFMKGGLMGTFAEKRINEVIKYLNNEPQNEDSLFRNKTLEEQQKLAEKYISMIGEPIIKNMLQKQLDSKRLQKVEKHQQIIENQEQKIKALEDRIKLLEDKS